MKLINIIFLILPTFLKLPHNGVTYMVGNNPYHRIETLDSNGKYKLEWQVDWKESKVTFSVTVETKGYIGFGLSSNGKMLGADIVIGGVLPNGTPYFSDYHAVANPIPQLDPSQDWTLIIASESDTHTSLRFSRIFDTCDPHGHDYPITEDKISLIWAYGERDNNVDYHHRNRGEYQVYLIHPDYTPSIIQSPITGVPGVISGQPMDAEADTSFTLPDKNNFKVWTINSRYKLYPRDTSYWCTIHKAPVLPKKHHVVGFQVRIPNEQSRRHIHHLSLFKCHAFSDRQANQMFSSYIGHEGQLCYAIKSPMGPMPTEFCTEFYQAWAVGGRPFFYPLHVGVPLGESQDEYYMLQVHYDNPNRLSNLDIDLSFETYYTNKLRPNEAGMMVYRHEIPGLAGSILIPPSSLAHSVYGFCGMDCTRKIIPPEGIRIFGLLLHSHNTGVAIRFQHFRGNRELPWIQSDENYGFDFQQVRAMNREVRVMPGDLLAVRCTYDSTSANGTVVGGFSSQHEMCAVFFYYYNRAIDYVQCSSEIDSTDGIKRFLGIKNVTWSYDEDPPEFVVNSPSKYSGKTITQVSDSRIKWDLEKREELQNFHLREPHVNRCPREIYSLSVSQGPENEEGLSMVRYPFDTRPYIPPRSCSFR